MRRATGLILQRHQILHLPCKMTLMSDVRHIWSVIYNARSNRGHPPTSPSTVPAAKNDSHHWSSWHMKRHLQCAEQQASPSNLTKCCPCHEKWCASLIVVAYETSFTMRGATGITLQPHQILRLPRKIALQNQRKICREQLKHHFQCAADSSMIRPWSEHDPTMIRPWNCKTEPVRSQSLLFPLGNAFCIENYNISRSGYPKKWRSKITKYCACHEKWHSKITKYCAYHTKWLSWLMSVTHDTSFTMRGATDLILQHHQMLRLPRKMTRIIYPRDIWNVIYNARSNKHHPPTSPNAAPATKNDAHHWLSSHMKRHLQCAEQQASPSNLTKYCACHAKLHSKIKE